MISPSLPIGTPVIPLTSGISHFANNFAQLKLKAEEIERSLFPQLSEKRALCLSLAQLRDNIRKNFPFGEGTSEAFSIYDEALNQLYKLMSKNNEELHYSQNLDQLTLNQNWPISKLIISTGMRHSLAPSSQLIYIKSGSGMIVKTCPSPQNLLFQEGETLGLETGLGYEIVNDSNFPLSVVIFHGRGSVIDQAKISKLIPSILYSQMNFENRLCQAVECTLQMSKAKMGLRSFNFELSSISIIAGAVLDPKPVIADKSLLIVMQGGMLIYIDESRFQVGQGQYIEVFKGQMIMIKSTSPYSEMKLLVFSSVEPLRGCL